jgi:hypothetical protein
MEAMRLGKVSYVRCWFMLTRTRVNDIATEDALLLQCLAKAGAVFHVRTNQPQSLMVDLNIPEPFVRYWLISTSIYVAVTTSPGPH